ncbi:hypothetical protein QTG54_008393 [Skeletonema marinoi]|uniref:Uncharacterized protein n=1 Tax=Skeletonema marinoi TaxID=267567 RepID=A0AAD8Y7D8_9STRA|nr:hypothetical protein QTG54_008393 [Skeletonema marinoi]
MATPAAASSPTSSSSSSMITSLLETVGIEIFICYLRPSNLISLSLTSHQLHDTILQPTTLIQICSQHYLPIQLGVNTNYLAELTLLGDDNNSHRSKRELVDHVLDKLHTSQLLLVNTNSIHDSEKKAKQLFLDENKSSAMCYAANDTSQRTTTVECHFQSNATKESATAWIDYILNRDACNRYGQDKLNNKLIRDWFMIILSSLQEMNDNSSIQIWRWGCKHSNLSGKGVSGVGVMISSSLSCVDDLGLQGLELELRLTRLY